MADKTPVIGVTAIGFGIMLIWAAYTKKPLFGTNGLIRQFITTGSLDKAGAAAGKAAGQAVQAMPIPVVPVPPTGTPPNDTPPGAPIQA